MEKYTITKRSYEKHGEEAADSLAAEYGTYEEAYAEARRMLEQKKGRRVLFLQRYKDGKMTKEYTIIRSTIAKGNGDIESKAREVASLEMAEIRKRRRKEAYKKAENEGRPFLDVYREMKEAAKEEDARRRTEIIKAEKKRLKEAKGETLQEAKRRQSQTKGQAIRTDTETMAELMAELDNIKEGKF